MKARFYTIAVCLVLDILLSVVLVAAFFSYHHKLMLVIGGVLSLLYIVDVVALCFFWHRAWRTIQDGSARTTPGKAVGFMFIPLFNLYWAFVLIAGFAKDYNAFCRRHEIGTPPRQLPAWCFRAVVILWLVLVLLRWLPIAEWLLDIVFTVPYFLLVLIRYMPVISAGYGIVFSLAMLMLLHQTARAVITVQQRSTKACQTPQNLS